MSRFEGLTPLGPNPRNRWKVGEDAADLVRDLTPPRPVEIEANPKPVRIDLARSALIIVDMQNDFCHADGWLAGIGVDVTGAGSAIAPLQQVLSAARLVAMPVIWVNWGNRQDLANISPALRHVYDGAGSGGGLGDAVGRARRWCLKRIAGARRSLIRWNPSRAISSSTSTACLGFGTRRSTAFCAI